MKEVWKDIPGFEGLYQASSAGRIRALARRVRFVSRRGNEAWRVTTEVILTPQIINSGYVVVYFQVDYQRTVRTVHSLVAKTFLGPRPSGFDVNHINGDKLDPRIENLEYVTRRNNHLHAVKLGLNKSAIKVKEVVEGIVVAEYDSLAQAGKAKKTWGSSIKKAIEEGTAHAGSHWEAACAS